MELSHHQLHLESNQHPIASWVSCNLVVKVMEHNPSISFTRKQYRLACILCQANADFSGQDTL